VIFRAPDPPLVDGVVSLRPLDSRDIVAVERALADPEITRWFDDGGLIAQQVVDRAVSRWQTFEAAEFTIVDAGDCAGSREGVLRSWVEVHGERVDHVSFSLVATDLEHDLNTS